MDQKQDAIEKKQLHKVTETAVEPSPHSETTKKPNLTVKPKPIRQMSRVSTILAEDKKPTLLKSQVSRVSSTMSDDQKKPTHLSVSSEPKSTTSETKSVRIEERPFLIEKRQYSLLTALIVVCLVALAWTGAVQFSKSAWRNHLDLFNAPFFFTYFNTVFLIFCYPGHYCIVKIYRYIRKESQEPRKRRFQEFLQLGFHWYTYGLLVFVFTMLNLAANYFSKQSLIYIEAGQFIAILATNSAVVIILAVFMLQDSLTLTNTCAVLLSIGGVCCVGFSERSLGWESWIGIVFAVGSAVFAAVYKVGFKRSVRNATVDQAAAFLSAIGLFNLIFCWPLALLLVLQEYEKFSFSTAPWGFILASSLTSLLFNLSVNFGIALTSPLFVSVGMFLAIPLNIVIDRVARFVPVTVLHIVGSLLILLSLALLFIPKKYQNLVCITKEERKQVKEYARQQSFKYDFEQVALGTEPHTPLLDHSPMNF